MATTDLIISRGGFLPPGLVVETLRSIQYLLFPYEDLKSTKILDQLIQRDGFDAECAEYDDYALDGLDEDKYLYWGQRIAALHKVIDNRPPRNSLERWLQRHDTERNVLFFALVGLSIWTIVSIIRIGLLAVQIWVSYEAWQHPVKD